MIITYSIIAITIILALAIAFRNRETITSNLLKGLSLPALVIVVGILLAWIQPYSLERVDSSGVGFKINLTGAERGISSYQYKTGWVVVNTWSEQFVEIATNQHDAHYDSIKVITKGGFPAEVSPTFNYSVKPDMAADMYISLRKTQVEIEQGWLKNSIVGAINDVSNRWTADSIFNAREQFESEIFAECNERVGQWFEVKNLRSNILPPKALEDAIVAKTKAVQNVQVAESNKLVAIATAETNIATAKGAAQAQIEKAKGDSAATVIAAKAFSEAMKLKQQQLTPLYVDYVRATTWDGALPTTVTGGAIPMLNIK